jgi:hypothetical protein
MAALMSSCFQIDHCIDQEERIFVRPPAEGNIFLTKCPKDILVVGPLLSVNPDLYVVYMLRDPRDIICSKHGKDPNRYWAGLRYWKTYTAYARKLQPHRRFITVRYEDLVSDPDSIQDELMQRMPFLVKKAPFSAYHHIAQPSSNYLDALGGVRPIAPVSRGNWRNHLPRVAGQLQLHGSIAPDLVEYGYEKDDAWLKELEGVTPDVGASHWPEYFDKRTIGNMRRGIYQEVVKTLIRRVGINPPVLNWKFRNRKR